MKFLIAIILVAVSVESPAVILIPGKIENPLRADKILTEKYNAKKRSLARYRKALKQKYANIKKAQAAKVTALAAAPSNEDQTKQSKGIPADGNSIIETTKPLQEVRETSH